MAPQGHPRGVVEVVLLAFALCMCTVPPSHARVEAFWTPPAPGATDLAPEAADMAPAFSPEDIPPLSFNFADTPAVAPVMWAPSPEVDVLPAFSPEAMPPPYFPEFLGPALSPEVSPPPSFPEFLGPALSPEVMPPPPYLPGSMGPSSSPNAGGMGPSAGVGSDPCVGLASYSDVPVKDAVACLRWFPFNLAVARATIDTLLKTLPHYVFTDLARDSPEPLLPSKVKLQEGLETILASAEAGEYETEFDFDRAVSSLFATLNDAHTAYTPACSSKWVYRHGFVLMSLVDGGRQQIQVAPEEYQPFLQQNFPDYLEVVGWEVLKINGMDALAYVKDFANHKVSLFKDLNARFNAALFNLYVNAAGETTASYGKFYSQTVPPSEDSVTFLFTDGTRIKEIKAYYYASYQGDYFFSGEDYFALNCEVQPDFGQAHAGSKPLSKDSSASSLPQFSVYVNEVITSGTLDGGKEKVGVISIPTVADFNTDVTGTAFFWTFMNSFVIGVQQLKAAGAKRLILDMTQDGGGYTVLANWLPNALFPKTVKILPTRLRANPLAVLAVNTAEESNVTNSMYHWASWAKGGKGGATVFKSPDGFFFPLVDIEYGGVVDKWSKLFRDKPASAYPGVFPRPMVRPFKKAPFAAKNILILTNGYCGSSCSIITSTLAQLHGVRTVTVGGIKGHPQQISNFPGSQVLQLDDLFAELANLGLSKHPLAPQPFLRSAGFSFTWRALYGPISKTYPLEFVFESSTFNLEYSRETVTSMVALYTEVAKLF